jgi:hypothetical protein
MSLSTDDNLGRRRYLLLRDKAVEHALERIRRSPSARWEILSPEEHAGLRNALAMIWENCGHERWEQYCFSTLSRIDILALTALVNEMQERHLRTNECHGAIEAILLSSTNNNHPH